MPRIPTSGAIAPNQNVTTPVGLPSAAFGQLAQLTERAGVAAFAVEQARTAARREIDLNRSLIAFTNGMNDLQLQADQQTDPEAMRSAWAEGSQRLFQETADGLSDPVVLEQFNQNASLATEQHRIGIERRATGLYQEQVVATADERADQLSTMAAQETDPVLRQQYIDEALGNYVKAGVIGALRPGELEAKQHAVLSKVDYASGLAMASDHPGQFLEVIKNPSNFPGLDPVSRVQLRIQAENAIAAAAKKIEEASLNAMEKTVSDYEVMIDSGQFADPTTIAEQVDMFHTAKLITTAKRTQLLGQILKVNADRVVKQQGIHLVSGTFDGSGVLLDPKDKKQIEAVNNHWNELAGPRITALPPAEQVPEMARYVERTGIVPQAIKSAIQGGLRAGNDQQAAVAADMIDRWERTVPGALRDFDENEIAIGLSVSDDVRGGIPATQAVKAAREWSSPIKESERKSNAERYNSSNPQTGNEAYLTEKASETGGFLGFFTTPVEIPDAMKGRYGALVERNASRGQPLEVSRRTALAQMKTVWAPTSVGTRGTTRWQEHAPEAVYGNAAGAGWIQDQLVDDLAAQGIEAQKMGLLKRASRIGTAIWTPLKTEARTVFLEPDLMSARDVNKDTGKPQPRYQIMTIGKLGEVVPLTDAKGNPLPMWFPQYSETEEFKAAIEARKAAIGQPRIVPNFEPGR